MARNGGNTDDLITAFLTPLSFAKLALRLRYWGSGDDSSRSVSLAICSHIMELRPSWWVEGMNHLMNEDGQDFMVEMTDESLRCGPCYDCPLEVTPIAFDMSLRTYTVNPFAVFPIVNVSDNA
ncbi:hypothetical protein EXIGLDRAFT_770550 [Exidia glandulosa HHB12029]|uniref:Uncharacterized protein n=1 Tax=Exidia glandulosa HHB12029 TaxID=1314781 RepID=A0A165GM68_EXIGL|nr:hypothetical protein EXIGLDRAFT_770550 [Exidia glandulosa HHB12029]